MARTNSIPGGVKSDKIWRDAIHRAVKERRDGKGKPQALETLARKLVAVAMEGDVSALKEIGDRLDGKPTQATEITGKDGQPIPVSLEVIFGRIPEKS